MVLYHSETFLHNRLETIAYACGFRKVDRMRSAFKSRYGVSPSECRRDKG